MKAERSNAKNTGKSVEKMLEAIHLEYRLRNIADLVKVDPPVSVLGGGFKRRVIFKPNPFLDYIGALRDGGRLLMIEAKSTEKPTLPVGGESGVTAKQLAAMKRWEAAGGLTAVFWYCFKKQSARILTIADIEITLDHRKSVTWETAIEIPETDGGGSFDYLPLIVKLDNLKSDDLDA